MKLRIDYYIIGITGVLLFAGILILSSVSAIPSQENFGKTTYYLFHQLFFGILPGIALGIVCYFLPLSWFKKWAWIAVLINLILMVLVFIPGLGVVAGGAPRWINFGFFTLQPSEILKITFLLYISAWLSNPMRKSNKKENFKYTFLPFLTISAVITFLLLKQSDLSTWAVIILIAGIMYFAAKTPVWHSVLMAGGGILLFAIFIFTSSYRLTRLKVMLGLITDPMGLGYQIKQILIGIGSGGIVGLGLGMSSQKFGFIPQTMSDSIFAIFSEETGFIGATVLVILFSAFLIRGYQIAKKSGDSFSSLFAVGFSSWICIQAFVNMGAMTGIMPLTGIPLPFMSYGGSHIVMELIGVGILLNISKSFQK